MLQSQASVDQFHQPRPPWICLKGKRIDKIQGIKEIEDVKVEKLREYRKKCRGIRQVEKEECQE